MTVLPPGSKIFVEEALVLEISSCNGDDDEVPPSRHLCSLPPEPKPNKFGEALSLAAAAALRLAFSALRAKIVGSLSSPNLLPMLGMNSGLNAPFLSSLWSGLSFMLCIKRHPSPHLHQFALVHVTVGTKGSLFFLSTLFLLLLPLNWDATCSNLADIPSNFMINA